MLAKNKLKYLILKKSDYPLPDMDDDSIEDAYIDFLESDSYTDAYWEAIYEIREGEEDTNIEPQYSSNYESKSVATKMDDGSWVGWTYWYGGGKHAEPEAIDWVDDAYDVEFTEEEKKIIVKTFTKLT